ncbi:protein-glutamate O-methyltransferase CheR [Roseiarcaceae bacterium H3SJ34-1]|uniref:CheR family methyltransferase n=1 Tax=Terripilifer ovatus TaxID=3032367 RepID=UPI003AB96FC0|nr:protein-glutamate O-methyltransferase CheR [Roseiarcaceae bacterium H3SJ34-1]
MIDWFTQFRTFVQKTTGVVVHEGQEYLVESRLAPILRTFGFASTADLIKQVLRRQDPQLIALVADAMMTSETFFFRDRQPFELFRTVMLPRLVEAKRDKRRIRIWSAACATGQEPYSLAMVLDEEARRLAGWQIEIVATDLSGSALETARAGLYNQFEVQRGLPISLLLRYFHRDNEKWRVVEHIRSRVRFQQLNLLHSFNQLDTFDIIFCRNVLMYFSPETRRSVMARMAQTLEPGGMLMLGATEFLPGGEHLFQPLPEHPSLLLKRPVALDADLKRTVLA